MAGDGEEEVVVEGWEVGEFVDESLGDAFGASTFLGYAVLGDFGEKFIRQFAQPGFEHGANDVNIVKIILLKEINIIFCVVLAGADSGCAMILTLIKSPLPSLDLRSAARYSV